MAYRQKDKGLLKRTSGIRRTGEHYANKDRIFIKTCENWEEELNNNSQVESDTRRNQKINNERNHGSAFADRGKQYDRHKSRVFIPNKNTKSLVGKFDAPCDSNTSRRNRDVNENATKPLGKTQESSGVQISTLAETPSICTTNNHKEKTELLLPPEKKTDIRVTDIANRTALPVTPPRKEKKDIPVVIKNLNRNKSENHDENLNIINGTKSAVVNQLQEELHTFSKDKNNAISVEYPVRLSMDDNISKKPSGMVEKPQIAAKPCVNKNSNLCMLQMFEESGRQQAVPTEPKAKPKVPEKPSYLDSSRKAVALPRGSVQMRSKKRNQVVDETEYEITDEELKQFSLLPLKPSCDNKISPMDKQEGSAMDVEKTFSDKQCTSPQFGNKVDYLEILESDPVYLEMDLSPTRPFCSKMYSSRQQYQPDRKKSAFRFESNLDPISTDIKEDHFGKLTDKPAAIKQKAELPNKPSVAKKALKPPAKPFMPWLRDSNMSVKSTDSGYCSDKNTHVLSNLKRLDTMDENTTNNLLQPRTSPSPPPRPSIIYDTVNDDNHSIYVDCQNNPAASPTSSADVQNGHRIGSQTDIYYNHDVSSVDKTNTGDDLNEDDENLYEIVEYRDEANKLQSLRRRRETSLRGKATPSTRANREEGVAISDIDSNNGAKAPADNAVDRYHFGEQSPVSHVPQISEDNEEIYEDYVYDWSDFDDSDEEGSREAVESVTERKSKLFYIVEELLETENTYVMKLKLLMEAKQKSERRSREDTKNILPYIDNIYKLHKDDLLPPVRDRVKYWDNNPRIGDVMKKFAPFLKIYTDYVSNFNMTLHKMETMMEKSADFASDMDQICEKFAKDNGWFKLDIRAHMLEPVQRVPRYKLILQDYLKHLPEDCDAVEKANIEDAIALVSKAADHFEFTMKQTTEFGNLMELEKLIECPVNIVSHGRKLLKEGPIGKYNLKTDKIDPRYLYLFNDLLLICTEKTIVIKGLAKYQARQCLHTEAMRIYEGSHIDLPHIFLIKTKELTLELVAKDEEQKAEWQQALWNAVREVEKLNEQLRKFSIKRSERAKTLLRHQDLTDQKLGTVAPVFVKKIEVTMCMICATDFSTFNRKHHCQACGIMVCSKCSSQQVKLEYDNNKENRVCDSCYSILSNPSSARQHHRTNKLKKRSQEICAKTGFLFVSTSNGRSWNRRYCEIHEGGMFYCYKASQDVKPVLCYDLGTCRLALEPLNQKQTSKVIKLFSSDAEELLLKQEDHKVEELQSLDKWHAAFVKGTDSSEKRRFSIICSDVTPESLTRADENFKKDKTDSLPEETEHMGDSQGNAGSNSAQSNFNHETFVKEDETIYDSVPQENHDDVIDDKTLVKSCNIDESTIYIDPNQAFPACDVNPSSSPDDIYANVDSVQERTVPTCNSETERDSESETGDKLPDLHVNSIYISGEDDYIQKIVVNESEA